MDTGGDVMPETHTLTATEFKTRCLSVFRDLEAHKYERVIITRHGKPIAEVTAPDARVPELWGSMRGSVSVEAGVDLTEPVLDTPLDAEDGKLHR